MLAQGARQLPLRHVSIRVPWHDTDWTGKVCQKPAENLSCMVLKNIHTKRDDALEEELTGRRWDELETSQRPPCINEHGGFMNDREFIRTVVQPYSLSSDTHRHMQPTPFRHPPFSAAGIPFAWMLSEGAKEKVEQLDLGFSPELEERATSSMKFGTQWVQTKPNQLVLSDTFFGALQPQRSLCFFYAKRIPLIEDPRRVLIGAGWVTHVGDPVEYNYSEPGPIQAIIWERSLQHSIRPDKCDGFLLPYQQLQAYLDAHPEVDPSDFVALVPDEHYWSFSFGTEHVTNDGAIASLLSCARAFKKIAKVLPGKWEEVLDWIDRRLNELWRMRGPYPGLGAALSAFGVTKGTLAAHELERLTAERGSENQDPWPLVETLFREPASLPPELSKYIGGSLCRKWQALPAERKALFSLLSRFELTADQATRYYVHEEKARQELGIDVTDADLLANPYRLFELDWMASDTIRLGTIDRGLFPDVLLRETFPLPEPSRVDDETDPRRVRAFLVDQLNTAARNGHTLLARRQVIQNIRALEVQPPCRVDGDLMAVMEDSLEPAVKSVGMADGEPAYQLTRMHRYGEVIRSAVLKRVKGRRHQANIDWRARLDVALGGPLREDDPVEERARREKTATLEELYASRVSVLIGPAGTGKTTLLKVLCNAPELSADGVLLLAPTGKARVRMEDQIGLTGAQTIAQFLFDKGRYYGPSGFYRLSEMPKVDVARTVIIDEASMLTEDQLAAVIDALQRVDRLVLVGDPRQLPPIGAGRPFLDIVRMLAPPDVEYRFPRVAPGYAELTVRRRQKGEERDDLLLAEWFSGRPLDSGADEIWSRVMLGVGSEQLRFVRWDTPDELEERLFTVLVEELGLAGKEDCLAFEQSLGGQPYGKSNFFWAGRDGQPGASAKVASWQILSPVRNASFGVDALNRLIQTTFRRRTLEYAQSPRGRKIPKPMGPQGILYGDKVINIRNHRRFDVWPKENALKYVANGEIGIVVGQYKTKNANYKGDPWKLQVEFSSQGGISYGYGEKDFSEEADVPLELAYALTVHKAQGSEFKLTLIVLPVPCWLLSRELLYTALTRQENRVVIFHQGDHAALKQYSGDEHSEAAMRLTNLFVVPRLQQVGERFLEDGLIHKTLRGECVRSKSEVIIANMLHAHGIDYVYEGQLRGRDGSVRYPDFTIVDDESGQAFYWEHLGMMQDPAYRQRWQTKLEWFRNQDILPESENGGPKGALITTEDDARGGIDSAEIEGLIRRLFAV